MRSRPPRPRAVDASAIHWRAVATLGALLACEGPSWIIAGEGTGGKAPSSPGGGAGTSSDVEQVCPSAESVVAGRWAALGDPQLGERHAGVWRGRLEGSAAAGFPSLDLWLQLDASGASTLRFGARGGSDATPEVLAADAGYLCRADESGVLCGTPSGYVAGFDYRLGAAYSRDDVLSFVVFGAEPWSPWCALQPPLSWPDASQPCGLAFGVRHPSAQPQWSPDGCARVGSDGAEPIDCALMYALERCRCARDACFGALDAPVPIGLTLSGDGEQLRGSLWYQDELDAASLVLARVP